MRKDSWDLDVVVFDGYRDHIGAYDSKAEAEQAGRELMEQCPLVIKYCYVKRSGTWSNSGFIEALD